MVTKIRPLWLWLGGAAAAVVLTGLVLLWIFARPAEPAVQTVPETTASPVPTNPLTQTDFAYQGDYLTCLTRPSVLGIDVSSHRGQIDWQQVAAAGIEFVMLRLGYRGTDLGGIYEDEWFACNYDGARAAGLQVGGYFFSQATSPEEALEEAWFAMGLLEARPLDMPLVYDWEDTGPDSRVAGMDPETLTDCTLAFCQAVAQGGYRPMVYFNPTQARHQLYLEQLLEYDFWLAMYTENMTFEYQVDMWQYTCQGKVPGIEGDVDINLYFPEN